jgi:hypothetical protein
MVDARMKGETNKISEKQKKGVAMIMSKFDGSILVRIRAGCISTTGRKSAKSVYRHQVFVPLCHDHVYRRV